MTHGLPRARMGAQYTSHGAVACPRSLGQRLIVDCKLRVGASYRVIGQENVHLLHGHLQRVLPCLTRHRCSSGMRRRRMDVRVPHEEED